MDDEDMEEMRRLRRSRGYAEHQQQQNTGASWSTSLHQHFGLKDRSTKSADHSTQLSSDTSRKRDRAVAERLTIPGDGSFEFQRPNLPLKTASSTGADDRLQDEQEEIGPTVPPPRVDDLREHSAIVDYNLPLTHEAKLQGHTKAVSAMALEPSGSRLLTGSYDYSVRMWDFNGMDRHMRSFREVEPEEGHQVVALSYSAPSPDRFLAVPASCQAVIFDRDGRKQCQFVRGDMYIRDLKHTKGHIMDMVGGQWHPHDPEVVMTASADGTVRLWDVNRFMACRDVIKVKAARGGRLPVTAAILDSSGKTVVSVCKDGSMQLFASKGRMMRPKTLVKEAHAADTETSSLALAPDNHTLLSRGGDNTLKVWDLRKLQSPIKVFENLPNFFPQTGSCFSPGGDFFITCLSAKRGQERGAIVIYKSDTLEELQRVSVADASAIGVLWHSKLNQILVSCADNATHVLYDPELSLKGVLLCVGKKAKKKDPSDFHKALDIHAPHTLPMFKKEVNRKRQRIKDRLDPVKAKIPELPVAGRGKGGEIGSSFSKYMLTGITKDPRRALDPREALLSYEEKTKSDPVFFGKAYKDSQPEPIFAEVEEENEEETDATPNTTSK